MQRNPAGLRRLAPLVALVALMTAAWAAWPASESRAPAKRYENLQLIADYSRGNPGLLFRGSSGEGDRVGSWRKLVEQLRNDPLWKTFPGRDLKESAEDQDLAQLLVFDFLGHQGWQLAAAHSDTFQVTAGPRSDRIQSYFFTREL